MTIHDTLKQHLTENGLWERETSAILTAYETDKINQPMTGRWYDQADHYPQSLIAVLLVGLDQAALTWLRANKPLHWAITMFDRDDPIHRASDGSDLTACLGAAPDAAPKTE